MRFLIFDLDDTLAPSKSPIDTAMAGELIRLLNKYEICIITGGTIDQITTQVLNKMARYDNIAWQNLHLCPTCGTTYYRVMQSSDPQSKEPFQASYQLKQIYANYLSDEEVSKAIASLKNSAKCLNLWQETPKDWGDKIENRLSQITFSALGQKAPLDAKKAWDPNGSKKAALRDAVAKILPDLEVRSGGSTSIDITHKGIDKAYGVRRLIEENSLNIDDIVFFGDNLQKGGNDYPVKTLGIKCVEVEGWQNTLEYLKRL